MLDEEIEIEFATLDQAETGGEFAWSDYVFLGIIGILVPTALLVVGAL